MKKTTIFGVFMLILGLAASMQIWAVCQVVEPEYYMRTTTDSHDYVRATGSFDMITVKRDTSSTIIARIEESDQRVKLTPSNSFYGDGYDFKAGVMTDFDVVIYEDDIQSVSWSCSVEGDYDTTILVENITLEFLFAVTEHTSEVFDFTPEVYNVFGLILVGNAFVGGVFLLLIWLYYDPIVERSNSKVRRLERLGDKQEQIIVEPTERCVKCPHKVMGND